MYFFLIRSLNFPQEMDKTASNRFCNMLMYALYKVLQGADACYNLPPGVWIFYDFQSEGKAQRTVLNVCIQCVCDTFFTGWGKWWGARKVLETKTPQGFVLIRLLKTYKSSSHPTVKRTHTSFVLTLSSHMHTHSPLSAANTADSADLPESQPALQLPSFLQTGNPQLPGLTPHANAVKQNPSLHLIHLDNPSKVPVPYLL